ncbi:hypothetical protein KKB11_06065 [Candidatus Micrarchaeota archaeon]|nr:hypothetical protein [Candidatus Micrarchaeota archaeon]
MKLNKKIVKKINFNADENGNFIGLIKLVNTKEINLDGKLEKINNHNFFEDLLGQPPKKSNEMLNFLPFKLDVEILERQNKLDENIEHALNNLLKFLEKGSKVISIKTNVYDNELELEAEIVLGKSYSSYSKHDEILIDINLQHAKILEAKNVPGLEDVIKK